ncbi:hypothetical protein RDABS01_023138 [Bienertia sinuspersici]
MNTTKNNTIIMSLKIVLMSTGILTIAILLSFSTPSLLTFATSHIPSLFSILRSWLRPPYLYFIINAIIISIAFLHNHHHSPPHAAAKVAVAPPHDNHFPSYDVVSTVTYHDNTMNNVNVNVNVVEEEEEREKIKRVVFVDDENNKGSKSTVVERSTWAPSPPLMRQGALKKEGILTERPPASASARFANHRRPAKTTPSEGGKSLKVSKPKKHDTLESTWKAITEGRHVPLNRHLKKSDTWENNVRQINVLEDPCPFPTKVKKSETFKERTNHTTPPVTSSKLKKEPSLGQDELNRRVEAFINKFNEDMRLQRQESMQQFMEMINRAA